MDDLDECSQFPLSFSQETHGELEGEALVVLRALLREREAREELERVVRLTLARVSNQDPANDEPLHGLDGGDFWKLKQVLPATESAAGMTHECKPRIPWLPSEAKPNRVPPREYVAAARAALDKTYAYTEAPLPLLVEALDWLRRALEQMADRNSGHSPEEVDDG